MLKGDEQSTEKGVKGSCEKKIEDVAGDEVKAGDCILGAELAPKACRELRCGGETLGCI